MNEAKSLRLQGFKITEIAGMLGKSERTIYKYLSEPARKRKKREYVSLLEPFKPFIDTITRRSTRLQSSSAIREIKKSWISGKYNNTP